MPRPFREASLRIPIKSRLFIRVRERVVVTWDYCSFNGYWSDGVVKIWNNIIIAIVVTTFASK